MIKLTQLPSLFRDEKLMCSAFCVGIIYSLFLWPLLNTILCICLGVYWLLFCKKNFDLNKNSSRLVIVFACLYLPYIVGMFYTSNKEAGYFSLTEHIAFLLFPVVFGSSRFLDQSMVHRLLSHFIISCLVASLSGFLFGLLPEYIHLPDALRHGHQYVFGYTYPYIIGLGCLLSILVIGENLYDQEILSRRFVFLILAFLSFYLLFLNVRLVSLCWLTVILYFIFRKIPSTGLRIIASFTLILMLVLGFFRIPMWKSKWNELRDYHEQEIPLDQDASLGRSWGGMSIRIALWKCGMDLIERHPLMGVGTGDVQDSLQMSYEKRKFYFASRYNKYNLHNQFLQTLAAFGVCGLIILLACIIAPVIWLPSGSLYRIRIMFLLLFFLICFTEVILDTNKGIIWYSFFNSIFAFGGSEKIENPPVLTE